ncbi:hypothetical protein NL676_017525 [Syzygium grande]|nr:hypothetical protein NL676_017525 [Syzygium grande]
MWPTHGDGVRSRGAEEAMSETSLKGSTHSGGRKWLVGEGPPGEGAAKRDGGEFRRSYGPRRRRSRAGSAKGGASRRGGAKA